MSAVGGGRSFQVFIDLILRGVPQVQSGLQKVTSTLTSAGRAANGVSAPFTTLNEGLRGIGTNSRTAVAGASGVTTAASTMGRSFRTAGDGAIILNNTLGNTAAQTRSATSGIGPLSSGLSQLGSASNTAGAAMSRTTAFGTALRENIRSMIFPIGGMIGALNEAAFMTGRVQDAEAKLSAAKGELNRLTSIGAQGTSEYAKAQKEVDEATRSLNFTTRIMTQSWFDVVFFMGSLIGSATGLIDRYGELRKGGAAVAGATRTMGSTFAGLIDKLTGTTLHFTKTNTAAKALVKGVSPLQGSIGKVTNSAKDMIPAMVGTTTALAALKGALVTVAGAAGIFFAALAGGITAFEGFRTNAFGLRDAMHAYQGSLDSVLGVSKETRAELNANADALGEQMHSALQGIPVISDLANGVASLGDTTKETGDNTETTAGQMVGIAHSAKVVSVALDGTLVPTTDLAKANLDLGATAGQLLEKNNLLGAGMTNLQTGLQVTGEQAILLAGAWIETEQAARKQEQALATLVVQHYGMATALRLNKEELMVLGQWLQTTTEAQDENNSATELAEVAQENAEAAEQRRTDSLNRVAEALTGLNEESRVAFIENSKIIAGARQMGQAFDETSVSVAAQASGIQTWRDELSQAYFNIVENATALGFFGDVTKENVVAMMDHIATQTRQNDLNAEAVEGWFNLTTEQQANLRSLGLTDEMMGQVALGLQDVNAEQAGAIQSTTELSEANKDAVESYFALDEGQRVVLESMGISKTLIAQVEQGYKSFDATMLAAISTQTEMANAVNEHAEALSKLDPAIQKVAAGWGLAAVKAEDMNAVYKAQMGVLSDMDSELNSVVQDAVSFIESQGQMSAVTGMSTEQLAVFTASMSVMGDTMETESEKAARASKEMAAEMESSFNKIMEAQEEWSGTMSGAIKKMSQEMGEEMEVGISDIEKKISKGFQGFADQFINEIFPEDFLATAIIEGNDPDDIVEELRDLWKDVVNEGIIEEDQAGELFQPFIDFMKEDLPRDTEEAMGFIVAEMPHLMEQISPVIVNGIEVAGGEARDALKSHLSEPFLQGLKDLESGASGIDYTRGIVEKTRALLPVIRTEFPQLYGIFKRTLDRTGQTTDEKAGEIIGYLRQIDPAFGEMVDAMDKDGDGIKDIFDNDIKTPAEQMRTAIVDAFIAVYDAMAMVDPSFGRVAEQLRLVQEAGNNAGAGIIAVNTATGEVVRGLAGFELSLQGLTREEQEAAIKAFELKTGFDVVNRGLSPIDIAAQTAAGGLGAVGTAATGAGVGLTGAGTAAGGLPGTLGSANTAMADLNTTMDTTTRMTIAWVGHTQAVSNAINQVLLPALSTYGTNLDGAVTHVTGATGHMSNKWDEHANAVGTSINGGVVQHMAGLAREYVALRNGVAQVLASNNQVWSAHANAVGTHSGTAIDHMADLAREYVALRNGVRQVLADGNNQWRAHSNAIRQASAQGVSAVGRLGSAVSSNMSRIRSAMSAATAAANTLRAAINRLQSKTITVTTRYRTTGTKPNAARGFNGVVNRPTDLHVGEGGRPELVNVTPLQGTSGAHLNGMAAFRGLTPTNTGSVRAAGGAGPGVMVGAGGGTMSMAAAKDDVTNYRRHVERELAAAGKAWEQYSQTVSRAVSSAGASMRGSTGTIRSGLDPRLPTDFVGPRPIPKNLPDPNKRVKDWLHEDVVESWARSYGYRTKSYDPVSGNRLKFKLSPGGKNFKYIFEDVAAGFLQHHGWRFMTGGYSTTGNYKTPNHTIAMDVQKAQHGLQAKVRKPTMILAGEHGTEDVSITPGRRRGRGAGTAFIIDNRIILDGVEQKRWLRRVANEGYTALR